MGAERPGLRAANAHEIGPLLAFSRSCGEADEGPATPCPRAQKKFFLGAHAHSGGDGPHKEDRRPQQGLPR
jgi:hypothetical protein